MAALTVALAQLAVTGALAGFFVWFFLSEIRSITAGAPFSPIPAAAVPALMDMAKPVPDDVVFDLGCGDGRMLAAALERGVSGAVGYDVGWWPHLLARRRLRKWGTRVRLVRADARTADISTATVVYLYLYPKLVDQLAASLARGLRPGARVLSAAYAISTARHPSFELIETRTVGTINAYLYRKR